MELDKCVGDYAAAIVRDANLLLADAENLNDEQKHALDKIKRSITHFISLCDEHNSLLYVEMFEVAYCFYHTLIFVLYYSKMVGKIQVQIDLNTKVLVALVIS